MTKGVILFADNDPVFLKVRKEFLEAEGYQVLSATDPAEARRLLEREPVELVILDIRLVDDSDDHDISGLSLAKEMNRSIPKIILTGFPTWETVREALGSHLDGLPLALDFISKQEGPEALLLTIDWTIHQPQLRANILDTFEIHTLMALPRRLVDLGPEEASSRLQRSFEITSEQLTQYREQENRRASQYHFWGLTMATMGMMLVLVSAVLILMGQIAPTTLPLIGGAISEAVGVLFFVREDSAFKRVSGYFARLNELNNLGNLITICDSLQSPISREEYKKKIIDKVVEKWFGT